MCVAILSLHTSTHQMPAHAALQTVMEMAESETLPEAAWELLVELIYNVYEHAGTNTANDTPWGVEIVPEADVVGLRVFDGGVGIAREELPRMFVERVPPLHFRGKGLLALQKHAMTGAVKDAMVSSRGTTVRFQGSHSTVTGMRASAPGVEITALCRRSGFQ